MRLNEMVSLVFCNLLIIYMFPEVVQQDLSFLGLV